MENGKSLNLQKGEKEYGINKKWYMVLQRKRSLLLILLPVSFFLIWLARANTQFTEYIFSRGIYKWLSQGVSLITGIFPFSLMEAEIILFPVLVIAACLRFTWNLIERIKAKQGKIVFTLWQGLLNMACIGAVLLFLYLMFGGLNYYRYPFAAISGLEVKESSVEELYHLNLELARKAAALREELHLTEGAEDANGTLQLKEKNWKEVTKTANRAYEKLAKEYPVLAGYYGAAKPVFFSGFMSRMEITGIFWPFTVEANVNVDVSPYSIPATMGHELAHLRGFMREDEANFISYLMCKESDNLEFQYSGVMLALSYAGKQLYRQDSTLYKQVQRYYNTGMIADLRQEYYYWKQFEDTAISTVSNAMNDNYLKANNQSDGVKSYGRMVDLLLAEYRKEHK